MMRLNLIALLIVLVGLGCAVFSTANRVQMIEAKNRTLNVKIEKEREGMRVLNAEWSFLNTPERLERLARDHFDLVPIDGRQYVALAAIPLTDSLAHPDETGHLAMNPELAAGPVSVIPQSLSGQVTPVTLIRGGAR